MPWSERARDSYVNVLVDTRGHEEPTVLLQYEGRCGPTSPEGDTKWTARDNHVSRFPRCDVTKDVM